MRGLIARAPVSITVAPSHPSVGIAGPAHSTASSPSRALHMVWSATAGSDATPPVACRWHAGTVQGGAAR